MDVPTRVPSLDWHTAVTGHRQPDPSAPYLGEHGEVTPLLVWHDIELMCCLKIEIVRYCLPYYNILQ